MNSSDKREIILRSFIQILRVPGIKYNSQINLFGKAQFWTKSSNGLQKRISLIQERYNCGNDFELIYKKVNPIPGSKKVIFTIDIALKEDANLDGILGLLQLYNQVDTSIKSLFD